MYNFGSTFSSALLYSWGEFFFKASPRGSAGTFREWKNDQYAASREPFSIEWSKPECALFGELMISALDQELFAH